MTRIAIIGIVYLALGSGASRGQTTKPEAPETEARKAFQVEFGPIDRAWKAIEKDNARDYANRGKKPEAPSRNITTVDKKKRDAQLKKWAVEDKKAEAKRAQDGARYKQRAFDELRMYADRLSIKEKHAAFLSGNKVARSRLTYVTDSLLKEIRPQAGVLTDIQVVHATTVERPNTITRDYAGHLLADTLDKLRTNHANAGDLVAFTCSFGGWLEIHGRPAALAEIRVNGETGTLVVLRREKSNTQQSRSYIIVGRVVVSPELPVPDGKLLVEPIEGSE